MKTYTLSNLDIAKMQADLHQARVIIMRLERENAELAKWQKCLAEIKAEAVTEFAKEYGGKFSGLPDFASSAVSLFADQYASKIRNTGTWLKDSNVNGGKRQGGAE